MVPNYPKSIVTEFATPVVAGDLVDNSKTWSDEDTAAFEKLMRKIARNYLKTAGTKPVRDEAKERRKNKAAKAARKKNRKK